MNLYNNNNNSFAVMAYYAQEAAFLTDIALLPDYTTE